MIPENWTKVKAIVGEALERAPDERAAFLDAACAQDAGLRKEVDSLLWIFGEQRRLMLAPRIEQVAGTGLHHQRQPELLRERAHPVDLARDILRKRIEMAGVEGERAALVSELVQKDQRLVEAMVRHAVGVVAEPEHFLRRKRIAGRDNTRARRRP